MTLGLLVIIAGGALAVMYTTKSLLFSVPVAPSQPAPTPQAQSQAIDYKITNQADADYQKAHGATAK